MTKKLMTADELWRLPEDHLRHELVAGELLTMPLNSARHGAVAAAFTASLGSHVITHRLGLALAGGVGFLLGTNPDTVRAPDGAFIHQDRVRAESEMIGYFPGAPDLTAEIIDPGDLYLDVEVKIAAWLEHGTRMVIVINPRRRAVAVHRSPTQVRHLTIDDAIDGEDVVPGWTLPVRDLFR